MSTIVQRIKELCYRMRISESKLASEIGVNPQTLNNYTSEKRKLGFEVVDKILIRYPQVSAEWLIRGIGNMMCCSSSDPDAPFNFDDSVCGNETANETANGGDIKDERIKLLEEKIAFLEEQVDFYKNKA